MAFGASDLLAPKGDIEPSLFDGEGADVLSVRLEEYLSEGYAKAPGNDEAARQWAYHRAYKAIYLRMSANPLSINFLDQASSTYSAEQARRFLQLSEIALGAFQALVAPESDVSPVQPTTSVKTTFTW